MRKTLIYLTILVATTSLAQAEICFRIADSNEFLRMSLQKSSSTISPAYWSVFGLWVSRNYTIPFSGGLHAIGATKNRHLAFTFANDTVFFDEKPLCAATWTTGGAFNLRCTGGGGEDLVSTSTLTQMGCRAFQ